MADLRWQISLSSAQNQMNPLSFVSKTPFSHTSIHIHMNAHTNGMPLWYRTALLRQSKPLFASIEHLSWLTKQRALRQIINIITLHCEWDSNPAVGFKINCTLRRITHTERDREPYCFAMWKIEVIFSPSKWWPNVKSNICWASQLNFMHRLRKWLYWIVEKKSRSLFSSVKSITNIYVYGRIVQGVNLQTKRNETIPFDCLFALITWFCSDFITFVNQFNRKHDSFFPFVYTYYPPTKCEV